ncbi:hypothetical protein [Paenibacillus terrae]|uniref:Uncharacterized protein n=1 Tax=Paenibacillus terrae TaxID=159743 RepID=A0A0D7WT20_9BACL|nr:hypothetical protein [Paenibacillus terrae]KJD42316.1 hypothetical protein QD47_28975 [Paenibacillus terrae]
MSEQHNLKQFVRGKGFTFTPSRIPDNNGFDYIIELNQLLRDSHESQNKFMETMLRDAIAYNKLKSAGLLNHINADITSGGSPTNTTQAATPPKETNHYENNHTTGNSNKPEVMSTEFITTGSSEDKDMSDVAMRLLARAKKTKLNV